MTDRLTAALPAERAIAAPDLMARLTPAERAIAAAMLPTPTSTVPAWSGRRCWAMRSERWSRILGGSLTVADVKETSCRGYVAHRGKTGVKPVTAARELSVLGAAIARPPGGTAIGTAAGLATATPRTGGSQAGVPFVEIVRYLGHEDSRTTERVYAHHAPALARTAAALDNRLRR